MKVQINIKKRYLFFRQEAKEVFKEILKKEKTPQSVYLDFSNVKFFSRSFVDEFCNLMEKLRERKIKVVIGHLKPELKKMLDLVQRTKTEIKKAISG